MLFSKDIIKPRNVMRTFQKWIYDVLSFMNKTIADEIHEKKSIGKDSFMFCIDESFVSRNIMKKIESKNQFKLQIQFYNSEIFDFFKMYISKNQTIELFKQKITISKMKFQSINVINVLQNFNTTKTNREIAIDFKTPTFFRLNKNQQEILQSKNDFHNLVFPNVGIMYDSLVKRLTEFEDLKVYIPDKFKFITNIVIKQSNRYKNIESVESFESKKQSVYGFIGRFKLLDFSEDDNECIKNRQFIKLFEYFGIGSRTKLGYGQCEIH